jgi:hypothetical protein
MRRSLESRTPRVGSWSPRTVTSGTVTSLAAARHVCSSSAPATSRTETCWRQACRTAHAPAGLRVRARTSLGSLACGPPHGFGGCRRRIRCTDDRRGRPVQRNERHIAGASTQAIGCASWDGRDQNAAADRTGRGREGRLERATGFPPAVPAWPVTALVSRSDGSRSRAARTQAASRASGLPLAGTDASRSDCVRTRPPGSAAPCPCRSRARPHRP